MLTTNTGQNPDVTDDGIAAAHSEALTELIRQEIRRDGPISFERYMAMALYEPGLGYYSAGARKIGREGDFITAPELSALFSSCIARQCRQIFELTGTRDLLELGAGTGIMAADILDSLARHESLPDRYLILEPSADLRERQQYLLQERVPDYLDRITWLEGLPDQTFEGVIVANEVLDAIPVHRLRFDEGELRELRVGLEGDACIWQSVPADMSLADEVRTRLGELVTALPAQYTTEYNRLLPPFIRSLSGILAHGAILLMDYGYPRREYYHPQRTEGTLICHHRHRAHDDPFRNIGLQDITAFVDFTAVAEAALECELGVAGYTTQAGFLLGMDIGAALRELDNGDPVRALALSQQAGQLLLPGQMGEKFKVMALTRGLNSPLSGFAVSDHRHRL